MSTNGNTAPIRKAVMPVAGLGTRFLPATRSVPKILLPILSVPVIDYAVRELAEAGIKDVALVMSRGMESVADYFRPQEILERTLEQRGKTEELQRQREISSLARVEVFYQDEPLGIGDAVLKTRDWVGDEAFAVLFPDDVIWGEPGATQQLVGVRNQHGGQVIAAIEVPDEVVPSKGIIDGEALGDGNYRVRGLVEKPALQDAPSNLSIVGRYILDPAVFRHLEKGMVGAGGEVQLTDGIAATLDEVPMYAHPVVGRHVDTGNPAGMLEAALFEAEHDPALRDLVAGIVQSWQAVR
jgi:UTP--glucose-1-phosphate uridylyltransferase